METNYYFIYYIRLLDCFPSVSKHHYLYYCIYSWRHSSTFSICLIVCHRQRFTCYVHKILDYAPNEMMNNKYYIWLTSKLDTKKISSEEKKQSMVFINIEFSVCPLCHTPTHPQIQNTRMRRQQEESAWGQSNVTYFHSASLWGPRETVWHMAFDWMMERHSFLNTDMCLTSLQTRIPTFWWRGKTAHIGVAVNFPHTRFTCIFWCWKESIATSVWLKLRYDTWEDRAEDNSCIQKVTLFQNLCWTKSALLCLTCAKLLELCSWCGNHNVFCQTWKKEDEQKQKVKENN